jgi:hypothetical protein
MTETESWGVLTKDQFDKFIAEFTKRFGKSTHSKRLSFSFWDHSCDNIDTRIRITNGKAEIMQKVGDVGEGQQRVRTEQRIGLQSDLNEIFNAYQILRVLTPGDDSCYIYQHDNYIFKQGNFEIKITHQSGKTDKYNFEVEAVGDDADLNQILKDLGLSEFVTKTTVEFWNKWNEELNLRDNDLKPEQIKEIIKQYLSVE